MKDNNHDFDKNYHELLAKLTLESVLGNEFVNLEHADKPDLSNKDKTIGIEVTQATPKYLKARASYFCENLNGKNISDVKQKGLKRFREHGDILALNNIIGGYYTDVSDDNYYDLIVESVDLKINKLNQNQYSTLRNYLYVFAGQDEIISNEELVNIIRSAIEHQKGKEKQFSRLFIDYYSCLIDCNLLTGIFTFHDTKDIKKDLCCKVKNNNLI